MIHTRKKAPVDHQLPTDADLAEITSKLDAAVTEVCDIGEQMAVQVVGLKRLNAALKAELAELAALRLPRSEP